MIKFEDFSGISQGRFFISHDERQAVVDMNKWIDENGLKIISVETIMAGSTLCFNCFRVWYSDVENNMARRGL